MRAIVSMCEKKGIGVRHALHIVGALIIYDDCSISTVTAVAMISAPASDDEGSTAATDGSTLRTSPAEHGGSVGSESGGSAIDSVAGEHSGEFSEHNEIRDVIFLILGMLY